MSKKEVMSDLYDFLKENETGLYKPDKCSDKKIISFVLVDFDDLSEFANILGSSMFDDGGIEVIMKDGYVAIKLNEIFESYGHGISHYKKCFEDYDYYEDEILKQESR